MKKNVTLENRLKKYSALAGTFAIAGAADAQIIYTDVNPDVTITGNMVTHSVDMNNDGTIDYIATTLDNVYSYTTYYYGMTLNVAIDYKASLLQPNNGNAWLATSSSAAEVLNNGALINAAANWASSSSSFGGLLAAEGDFSITTTGGTPVYGGPISVGNWAGVADRYVGVRFDVGANTYYGWVRLTVSADGGTITIKDYAYNATPNGSINAGQAVAIEEGSVESHVVIKNTNDQLNIQVGENLSNGSVDIVSMNGQVVANYNLQNGSNAIDLNGFSTGIYIVNIQFNEGVMTKKIYIR